MPRFIKAYIKLPASMGICLLFCSGTLSLAPSLTLAQQVTAMEPQSAEGNIGALEPPKFDPTKLELQSHAPAVIHFNVPKTSADLPDVRFGIFDLLVLDKRRQWQILVALDASIVAGDYVIYFNDDQDAPQGKAIPLTVVADTRSNTTYDAHPNLANILVAQPTWPRALSALDFLNSAEPNLPFRAAIDQPLEPITTQIERVRFTSRRATALTMAAESLPPLAEQNPMESVVPLVAPSQGIVTNILEVQDSPTLLILDHGRSLISLFAFNGTPEVSMGSGVAQGQVLANIRISAPARETTQPDFLWWASLNGAIISPQHFIDWPTR